MLCLQAPAVGTLNPTGIGLWGAGRSQPAPLEDCRTNNEQAHEE